MPRLPAGGFLSRHLGEAAALATAVCWSVTPFFFTAASRRIGSFSANDVRLVIACALLGLAVLVTTAGDAPPPRQTLLFVASGLIGLTLGDAALFESLVILGPRRVSLLGALAPVVVAVVSVPLLGETLTPIAAGGMALTLGGVAWVVLERPADGETHGSLARGVVLGALAAAGQGLGAICAKAGLGDAPADTALGGLAAGGGSAVSITALEGTLIRMLAGCAGMLVWAALRGRVGEIVRSTRDGRAMSMAAGGAVFGPFVGVWLSLVAFKHTSQTAVAQTIMSFSPVLVIVIARSVHHERPSARAWLGSFAAIAGVAVLALREEIAALL
jgi:drug/metabolite transporter (DMT)-like permease